MKHCLALLSLLLILVLGRLSPAEQPNILCHLLRRPDHPGCQRLRASAETARDTPHRPAGPRGVVEQRRKRHRDSIGSSPSLEASTKPDMGRPSVGGFGGLWRPAPKRRG